MERLLKFNDVFIKSNASVVGKMEKQGPLSEHYDICVEDEYFGQKTWEQAESEMVRRCINVLLGKCKYNQESVEFACGGDLLNQCVASSFGIKDMQIPFFGLYGACSTFAESNILAAALISAGFLQNGIAYANSHFCSAEKQYRFPLEYGGQRPPTSQYTVTGCGAFLLENQKTDIQVKDAVVGKIVDAGITDVNNMGAAMARAAASTIKRYFRLSDLKPKDFDVIATGDLGREGYELVCEELSDMQGFKDKFTDCGMLIYDYDKQDVHAGGSGCGCSAVVTSGYFVNQMKNNKIKNLLLVGTGALMNTNTVFQGQSISGIAHAIRFEAV